jgi:hypothetical protein
MLPLMLYAPRCGAIWARYFAENNGPDSGALESAYEKADDHWDSTHPLIFWLCVIFCPYFPQYQLATKFYLTDAHFLTDYLDTIFFWTMLAKVMREQSPS